jgi:hypothetical protein
MKQAAGLLVNGAIGCKSWDLKLKGMRKLGSDYLGALGGNSVGCESWARNLRLKFNAILCGVKARPAFTVKARPAFTPHRTKSPRFHTPILTSSPSPCSDDVPIKDIKDQR